MTTVQLSSGTIAVRLAGFERVAGLLGDLDVPIASVVSAVAVSNGLRATRGLRAPASPSRAGSRSALGAVGPGAATSRCVADRPSCCGCRGSGTTRSWSPRRTPSGSPPGCSRAHRGLRAARHSPDARSHLHQRRVPAGRHAQHAEPGAARSCPPAQRQRADRPRRQPQAAAPRHPGAAGPGAEQCWIRHPPLRPSRSRRK
jgi:hypothetical protein